MFTLFRDVAGEPRGLRWGFLYALLLVIAPLIISGCAERAMAPVPRVVPDLAPAALLLTPADTTLDSLGDSITMAALVHDASGRVIPSATLIWRSSEAEVATVNAEGEVIGRKTGIALVIATAGMATDTSVVRVQQNVSSLEVSPAAISLVEGDSLKVVVTALDRRGHVIASPELEWTSDAPGTARAVTGGWVVAQSPGTATVAAKAGGRLATAAVTVAPGPGVDAQPADAFVSSIGVNVHLSYFNRVYGSGFESIIRPRLRELGVRHLRDSGRVHDNTGWMNLTYGRYRQVAQETGARFTIFMSPAGTGSNYGDMRHVRTLLDHIGWENVEAFEGLNEHDLFGGTAAWPTQVRTLQQSLYKEIKSDPAMARRYPVLGPSLARPDRASQVGDLSAFMDYATLHPYPGGGEPRANLDSHVEKLRPMNSTRPLVVTEVGYHTSLSYAGGHPPVSESAMGRYVPRLLLSYFAAGIQRTFLYELIDEGSDPRNREHNFGLLRLDGSEKPAFRALRNIIRLLEDPGAEFRPGRLAFTLDGDTANIRQLLLQKRDGTFYLILWHAVASYDLQRASDVSTTDQPLTVRLAKAAGSARVFQPLTGSSAVATYTGASQLQVFVPDHPIVIEITR